MDSSSWMTCWIQQSCQWDCTAHKCHWDWKCQLLLTMALSSNCGTAQTNANRALQVICWLDILCIAVTPPVTPLHCKLNYTRRLLHHNLKCYEVLDTGTVSLRIWLLVTSNDFNIVIDNYSDVSVIQVWLIAGAWTALLVLMISTTLLSDNVIVIDNDTWHWILPECTVPPTCNSILD